MLRRYAHWLLCLSLSTAPAWSQMPQGGYSFPESDGYFGFHVGHVKVQDVDDDGSFNVGLDGGYYFLSRFAVGATFDFQRSEFEIEEFGITLPAIDRETYGIQADLSFTPMPDWPARPYLVGGVGYYWSKYSNETFSDGHVADEGYFAGLGLDFLGGGWRGSGAMVVEARWLFTQEATFGEAKFRPDGFNVSVGYRAKF